MLAFFILSLPTVVDGFLRFFAVTPIFFIYFAKQPVLPDGPVDPKKS